MSEQINECIQYTSPDPCSECIYVGDNILPVPLSNPRRNRKQFTQPISGSHCCIMEFLTTNGLKPQPKKKKKTNPQPRANSSLRGRVKRGLKWQPATKGVFLSSVRNGRGWDKTQECGRLFVAVGSTGLSGGREHPDCRAWGLLSSVQELSLAPFKLLQTQVPSPQRHKLQWPVLGRVQTDPVYR